MSNTLAFDLDLNENSQGLIKGKVDSVKRINLDGELTLKFDAVGDQRIQLSIDPGRNVVVLNLNEKKEITLNKYNVRIAFRSFLDNEATIRIEKLEKQAITAIIAQDNKTDDNPLEDITGAIVETEKDSKFNMKYIYIAILIIIVIIIASFVFPKGGTSEKHYKKASDLHREAEEFHQDGDEETAEELHKKAEEIRNKARELEYK